jgi:transporter family protein
MPWFIYAILSASSAAIMSILAKLGKSFDPIFATAFRATIMLILFGSLSLFLNKFNMQSLNAYTTSDWLYLAGSGLVMSLGLFFYFSALDVGNAAYVVAIDRLAIIMVLILSVIVLGEPITWLKGIGALFMLLGAVLITSC